MEKEEIHTGSQFNFFWYFMDICKNSFLFNNSSFMACIGKRRSGKSVFCLAAACAVDPDFNAEQITFGIKELKEQLEEKTNTSIIWEEAGTSAYSRDFMEERNKAISKTLQVYGFRKLAIFGNFQHMKFLDGDIRLQLDSFFRMKAFNNFQEGKPVTKIYAEPFTIVTDYIQEPLIAPYKIEREGTYQPIGKIPIPDIKDFFKICGVSKQLYKDYLRKKTEYFMEVGKPEEPEEEVFSKRELKTLTRVNESFLKLALGLLNENMTKSKIASLADIPVSTLNVWLSKEEEAQELINRISLEPTTTKKFFQIG